MRNGGLGSVVPHSSNSARDHSDSTLRELLDKQEIHEAILRYCRGIDRADEELIESTFHPGARQNHAGTDQPTSDLTKGLQNPARRILKSVTHTISNVLINVDKDVADAESYFVATHRLHKDGMRFDWVVGGRYLDRFERRNSVWGVVHKVAVYDWDRLDEVSDYPSGLDMVLSIQEGLRGTQDRNDPSYKVWR